MSLTQTRPIPAYALNAFKKNRIAAIQKGRPDPLHVNRVETDFPQQSSRERSKKIATMPWQLAFNASAAIALSLIAQNTSYTSSGSTPSDFLVAIEDNGLSRAMLNIQDAKSYHLSGCSRAEASLQEMELTTEEARAIDESLANKSARPKIKLPRIQHVVEG